jgi:hypothetical protein
MMNLSSDQAERQLNAQRPSIRKIGLIVENGAHKRLNNQLL